RLVPLQSWPLAWWPDGALKWTAHAHAPGGTPGDGPFEVIAQRSAPKSASVVTVKENAGGIEIDTGRFVCRLARTGREFVTSIERNGGVALRDGKLVLLRQDGTAGSDD